MRVRDGFSMIEALIVINIISLLVLLLIPAVNAARESARSVTCQSQIRQIGIATIGYYDANRQFPSGGWGWGWLPDPSFAKHNQPGGWCFSILDFLEYGDLVERRAGSPKERRTIAAEVASTSISVFYCPSRRRATLYPYNSPAPANAPLLDLVAKTDYAGNGGDVKTKLVWGPRTLSEAKNFEWNETSGANGIFYQRSRVRMRDVTDGASHTYLIGEKHVTPINYDTGADQGDDQTAFTGHDKDSIRWTMPMLTPRSDTDALDGTDQFGSAHPGGSFFVMCDGSVRRTTYDIDPETFRRLGSRRDGLLTGLD